MSLLSWNCRGLGNPQTVNALKKAIRIEKPDLVFLMETKFDKEWMTSVRDRCGFKESFVVPSLGASGGLALFWNSNNKVKVSSSSQSHIDANVDGSSIGGAWHLTGFYGNPVTSLRLDSWRLLSSLCDGSSLPWLVIGDFNEICCASEKEGGAQRPNQQMAGFRNVINSCGLKEVEYIGPKFTWIYQMRNGSQIRERLDRALVSVDWSMKFPSAKLFHRSSSVSDHSPILLRLTTTKKKKNVKRIFRFESMWLQDQRCEGVVLDAWQEGLVSGSDFPILSCLELCRHKLEAWNVAEFGHVGKEISRLQRQLE